MYALGSRYLGSPGTGLRKLHAVDASVYAGTRAWRARYLRGSVCGDAEVDGSTDRRRTHCDAPLPRPQLLAAYGARHHPRASRDENVRIGLAFSTSHALEMDRLCTLDFLDLLLPFRQQVE